MNACNIYLAVADGIRIESINQNLLWLNISFKEWPWPHFGRLFNVAIINQIPSILQGWLDWTIMLGCDEGKSGEIN